MLRNTTPPALPTPSEFDFSEFIRPLTILGKLSGLRRVPARVRQIAATAGSTAFWSGQANARPISRITLTGDVIEQLSCIAMLVTTRELLMSSSPSAESVLSRDLAAAIVQAMDSAFINSSNSGVAGVTPAAVTYGTTAIHSSGSSLANIDGDLNLITEALSDAGSNLQFATWVLRPRTAIYLSGLRGSGGALAFPQMTVKGAHCSVCLLSQAHRCQAQLVLQSWAARLLCSTLLKFCSPMTICPRWKFQKRLRSR